MNTFKKAALTLFLILLAINLQAQKGKVNRALTQLDMGEIDKAWETIQEAKGHDKAIDWPKTYYVLGRIYQAIGESDKEEVQKLAEEPLQKAFKNYKKAMELDDKDRINTDVDLMLAPLSIGFINKGINAFNEENYEKAFYAFQNALEVGEMPVFGDAVDTTIIYNAALAANNAGMYDEAVEYYNKAIEYNYGGPELYIYLKNVHLAREDSAQALETLKKGFEKYQDDNNIVIELVNYYLVSGNSKEALEYIDYAKKTDPSNASLYFAEGTLYEQMGEQEKARESYERAIEIDPTLFNAYYNLGVLFYNKAANMYEEAQDIKDNTEYAKAMEEANEVLAKAIPYMEEAKELNPDEISVLETLKTIYYRLKMEEKLAEVTAEIEEMKGDS